ncbi:hypothetical protein V5O48_013359 [Marasmius crinis-equi]|uniref:NADP-dependent oxidoreductase domain-containing protein n=1 Tax=Marasmius crinis-equi TaxID=585013 RepID=A0ABR3F0A5_9AGAR
MPSDIPQFALNNGTKIPAVGLGCWMGSPGGGARVYEMVQKAIKNGYRHFDTAAGYEANQPTKNRSGRPSEILEFPEASFTSQRSWGIVPVHMFRPLWRLILPTLDYHRNTDHHRVQDAFTESLQKLDSDYIDLYLMHWPQASVEGRVLPPEESPTIVETWKEMEKLLATGKVKTLGVSNFSIKTLGTLLPHSSVVPATNQVELHPFLPSVALKAFCEEKGILLTAYSPLGNSRTAYAGRPSDDVPGLISDPTVVRVAKKLSIDPGQVLLSWAVQKNIIVVPKTENETRMRTNITLVTLPPEDLEVIDNLHTEPGKHRSLLGYHSAAGEVFGWTYEWLGWNMKEGGIVV